MQQHLLPLVQHAFELVGVRNEYQTYVLVSARLDADGLLRFLERIEDDEVAPQGDVPFVVSVRLVLCGMKKWKSPVIVTPLPKVN